MNPLNATISFGLVSVPVKVIGAVKGTTTKQQPLTQLHKKCSTPIKQPKVCPVCDVKLGPDDIVKGVKEGKLYRIVDLSDAPEEKRSDVIRLVKFTRADRFAWTRIKAHYLLVPTGTVGQVEAYSAVGDALIELGACGFGYCSLWGKEHPVCVQSSGGALLLQVLHHEEDMVSWADHGVDPDQLVIPQAALLQEARRTIEAFTDDVAPEEITTEARLWRKQLRGGIETVVMADEPTVDILDAMRESQRLAKAAKKRPRKAKA